LDSAEASLRNEGKPLLEVYAMRASANLLDDKPIEEYASQALSENPLYGDFYATVAHFYIITYRYREAIELYQKAVKINPELASAQRDLGINYLRVNNLFAARYHIKKAFDIDPFDAETVNTLRLMDSLDGMRISAVDVPDPADPDLSLGRVLIRLDREDADALEPYVKDLSIKAVQELTERYDFRLTRPMVVELYHDHDDFGVRTVSTPGIGLLGVTFGYLTAMDSPKARPAGDFHWGTTLWHEIAHVFTLSATNHRLPRWFSEGLSVYEEWNTGPLRDRTIGIDTLIAISKGALLPVEELDSGFVRPSYQGQVQVSYTQAGLICDFISKNYGHEALVTMLREFADAKPTSSALMSAIGIDGPTFDALFLEHIENQYGELARDLDDFQVANRQLGRAVNAEDWISAEIMAKDIIERDPSRVSAGNVYEVLAQAQREQGNEDASTQTLLEWHSRGGHGVASLQILIRALRDQNRIAESAEVIESLNWVYPYAVEEHRWLGDYYLETEQASRAIREYEALLGLRPQDPAVAWLGKAKAQLLIGDAEKARRQVLYALESAPFYRDAQKLLLEFNEGESVD
jgi:tetratricopeptide (TPR) repeat protein